MRHETLPRLSKSTKVAHSKTQQSFEVRFVNVAKLSQFCERNFSMDRHFACYIELVNSLKASGIVLKDQEVLRVIASLVKV